MLLSKPAFQLSILDSIARNKEVASQYHHEYICYNQLQKQLLDTKSKLEKSQQQSTVKKLQEARLQSDYERVKGILDRIPPEIIQAYTQRGSKKQEVNHYSGLE